jgi:hypothetical protein
MSSTSSASLDLASRPAAPLPVELSIDDDDARSDLSHISSVDPTDPFKDHSNEEYIGLHLAMWRVLATRPDTAKEPQDKRQTKAFVRRENTRKKAEFRTILEYFLNIAEKHRNLKEFPATKILRECLEVANSTQLLSKIPKSERLGSREAPTLVSAGNAEKFRGLTFENLPIHNFFDALALVYTLCAPEISDVSIAERFLCQVPTSRRYPRHQKHWLSRGSSYGCSKLEIHRWQRDRKARLRLLLPNAREYPNRQSTSLL